MSQQPLPTSQHPECPLCANPDHAKYTFVPEDGVYPIGDIFSLKESVHKPIEHMSSRLGIYSGRVDSHYPPWRPAVIWPREPAEEGRYVCLMTGYHDTPTFEDLPPILQHFCLPISPHGLGDSRRPMHHHVHTTPEWQKPHQWLIAYPFVSNMPIGKRWRWADSERNWPRNAGFKIAQEPLSELDEICTEKFNEWATLCIEEPEKVKEDSDKYNKFRAQKRGLRTPNASRATFRTTSSAAPAQMSMQVPATPPVVPPPPASASPPVEDSGVGRGRGRGRWVRGVWRAFKRGRARGQSRA